MKTDIHIYVMFDQLHAYSISIKCYSSWWDEAVDDCDVGNSREHDASFSDHVLDLF